MTDYTELVKELRFGAEYGCDYDLIERAAAAIEELSANVADKDYQIREQWEEIQRLRADVKRQQDKMFELAKKLPKRSQWTNLRFSVDGTSSVECILCGATIRNGFTKEPNYCPNCGAKMEVQDGE